MKRIAPISRLHAGRLKSYPEQIQKSIVVESGYKLLIFPLRARRDGLFATHVARCRRRVSAIVTMAADRCITAQPVTVRPSVRPFIISEIVIRHERTAVRYDIVMHAAIVVVITPAPARPAAAAVRRWQSQPKRPRMRGQH